MKIFTTEQIRACDVFTIQASRMLSIDLMERAATKCVEWIKNNYSKDTLFVVLCGSGNNGGDGLAIARLLDNRGYGVKAFILKISNNLSPDCNSNFLRLQNIDESMVSFVEQNTFITDLPPNIIIIDAIFGTGLSRPVTGWVASFIDEINQFGNTKIAIDLPSGMPADSIPDAEASIIKADVTLSFQFYKRSFLHPESAPYLGKLRLLDIGLDKNFISATHTQFQTLDKIDVCAIYKPRLPYSHKGTYGNALLIGGSYGKIGALTLCAKAAIRSGAGLVTALLPECGYNILQTSVPEIMCKTSGEKAIELISNWEKMDAIGIGPGLGTDATTANALSAFLDSCKQPIVLDADAINLVAMQPDLISKLPKNSILTPHPKEFVRLFGENTNSMIQIDHARIQAMRHGIIIILKNHHTAIISPEGECWYNTTGNPGMATAGSGDVLTGIITGLLAQKYTPIQAALFGVYLHGLAGDLAAEELSEEAMVATDIISFLGKSFLKISK